MATHRTTIHYENNWYKKHYFTIEWTSKTVRTQNGRKTLWSKDDCPVYLDSWGPMRLDTLRTEIIQELGEWGGQDIYEASRAPHGRQLKPGEFRVLQDSDDALSEWERPLPHYDARISYTPAGEKRPVRTTMRDIFLDDWDPMVEKLHDLCDERNVSTVRADGDTADVPEILDLLIHGGPLDKWGHPVLDITEVTRYLTDDANAEVLPR